MLSVAIFLVSLSVSTFAAEEDSIREAFMTMDSLTFGVVLGVAVAGMMIWMSCVYSVFSSGKVVYLFGKASPACTSRSFAIERVMTGLPATFQ